MIAFAIFFVKMIRKSLFRPIKELRNDKPNMIQVSLRGHAKRTLFRKIYNMFWCIASSDHTEVSRT